MRHRQTKALFVFLAALVTLSGCGLLPTTSEQQPIPTQILGEQSDALKTQFNADRGKVRLLFIMDPNCGTCLKGLADIDNDLLATLPAQAAVYVVHLPVVGGTPKHIPGAASLVEKVKAHHYWDPKGTVGKQFSNVLALRSKGKPTLAWDVWLAYGPDAAWDNGPPKPQIAMHQLSDLDPNPISFLNSEEFASRVKDLAAESPE